MMKKVFDDKGNPIEGRNNKGHFNSLKLPKKGRMKSKDRKDK